MIPQREDFATFAEYKQALLHSRNQVFGTGPRTQRSFSDSQALRAKGRKQQSESELQPTPITIAPPTPPTSAEPLPEEPTMENATAGNVAQTTGLCDRGPGYQCQREAGHKGAHSSVSAEELQKRQQEYSRKHYQAKKQKLAGPFPSPLEVEAERAAEAGASAELEPVPAIAFEADDSASIYDPAPAPAPEPTMAGLHSTFRIHYAERNADGSFSQVDLAGEGRDQMRRAMQGLNQIFNLGLY